MCWNADISLNTFLFGLLSLVFIYFTNTYSKYKLHLFDNPIMYLFFIAVISIQLVEYFIWKHLRSKQWNEWLSRIASWLILLQPLIAITIIPQDKIKYGMILLYIVICILYIIYRNTYHPFVFRTTVSKSGHLSWDWMAFSGYENIFILLYVAFYLPVLYFINNIWYSIFSICLFFVSLFTFLRDGSFGSMWCWLFNSIFLVFLIYILLVQPFYEYNRLC
jgi:hypothetical protein